MNRNKKIIEISLYFTILGSYISKGIHHLSIAVLLIALLIGLKKTKIEKKFLFLFIPVVIGVISNFMSIGINGVFEFFKNERGLVYPIIFILIGFNRDIFKKSEKFLLIGSVIAGLFSALSYFNSDIFYLIRPTGIYVKERMPSFQDNIRWGFLLNISIIFIYYRILFSERKIVKMIFIFLEIFFIWLMIINGSRATPVVLALTIIFTGIINILYMKKNVNIKGVLLIILIISVGLVLNQRRFTDIKIGKDVSTVSRVHLIKIGIDVLEKIPTYGVGSNRRFESFNDFIGSQNEEYKNKYYYNSIMLTTATPYENYYINMAVENGLIFLISLLISYGGLILYIMKKVSYISDLEIRNKSFMLISIFVGIKLYSFFFPESVSFIDFLSLYFLFYSYNNCFISQRGL